MGLSLPKSNLIFLKKCLDKWVHFSYVANSPYTVATGTKSAGGIAHKVKKKFTVEVMFITSSKVICKVVDGFKEKKGLELSEKEARTPEDCELAK